MLTRSTLALSIIPMELRPRSASNNGRSLTNRVLRCLFLLKLEMSCNKAAQIMGVR
jgi:hypothetical protein